MTATPLAGRRAASHHTTAKGDAALIHLHAQAHNALNMAAYYLRQPAANVPGAARKVRQALAALRHLEAAEGARPAAAPERCPDADVFIAFYGDGCTNAKAIARFKAYMAAKGAA